MYGYSLLVRKFAVECAEISLDSGLFGPFWDPITKRIRQLAANLGADRLALTLIQSGVPLTSTTAFGANTFPRKLSGEYVVRLKEIIRAPKTNIKIGQWRSGKVPRADFPIARAAYRLGNSFNWCVIEFEALSAKCRVLVVINEGKQKFEAILGVMGPSSSLRILCSYECHPSEPGWHCHATHDDVDTLTHGVMRGPWIRRVPGARKVHRIPKYPDFKISADDAAIHFAQRRYRIEEKGPLL